MPDVKPRPDTNPDEFVCRLRGAAVCIDGGRVLLVCHHPEHASSPYWVPPGGGVLPGEALQDAALRELHEETGYNGQIAGVFAFREVFKPAGTVFEVFFQARLRGDPASAPSFVSGAVLKDARWFSADELSEVRVYPQAISRWLHDPDGFSISLDRISLPPVAVKRR